MSSLIPMQMVASGFLAGALKSGPFRAAFADVQFGLVAAGEKSGRFQDHVDAQVFPRQISRVAFLEDLNLVTAHDDVLVVVADFAVEFSVDRVPFQEMREGFGVGEIVDRLNAFDLFLRHRAQDVAPDAPEAVDCVVSHRKDLKVEELDRYRKRLTSTLSVRTAKRRMRQSG